MEDAFKFAINSPPRFIGQREPTGNSKVPSVICYDRDGNVVAVGAETDPETNSKLTEMEGDIVRVEWLVNTASASEE